MLRLSIWLLLMGCNRPKTPPKGGWAFSNPNPDGGEMASKIDIGDPSNQWQRLEGIYDIQEKSWAWTAPKFSVVLARRQVLRVRLYLAQPQIDQLKEVTLRAFVNGVALPPETYRKAGPQVYVRPLDPKLLDGQVRVDFIVDHAFQPKPPDTRALGIVVNSIAIEEQ